MNERGDLALLVLLCLALYLPGMATIPPVDRDEARFAQATRQMVDSGDFIRPRFQDEDWFKKPIGIYWLQATAVMLTRQAGTASIWAYRLPSLLGALGAVLATYWVGRRLFNRHTALLGAALLAASILLTVEAHQATTDAPLLACVVVAQGCLAEMYRNRSSQRPSPWFAAGFWMAQAFGVLLKGPVLPAISALTITALALADRRRPTDRTHAWLTHIGWKWGVPLATALVAPWGLAVGIASDWRFYMESIGGDILPKLLGSQESHGAPPGLYLLLVGATFWPGSLVMGLGLARAARRRHRRAERFCLAWLVPSWIMYELIHTKLPHYVLPLYPALALLTARAAFSGARRVGPRWTSWVRIGTGAWAVFTVVLGLACVAAPLLLGTALNLAGIASATAAVAIALIAWRSCRSERFATACAIGVIGAVFVWAPWLQYQLPAIDQLWLSRAVAQALREHGRQGTNDGAANSGAAPIAAVGYHEPSLVFLVGTDLAVLDPPTAAAFLRDRPDALVLVSQDQEPAFTQAAARLDVTLREFWSTDGIDYTKGRRTRLRLISNVDETEH